LSPVDCYADPANTHRLVSNRNDTTFGPGNDSIAVFDCADSKNASLTGLYPAHGSFLRHFEFSADWGMLAVAVQDEKVVVAEWDGEEAVVGTRVAGVMGEGRGYGCCLGFYMSIWNE
jgi:6-phosphogluconolactonase (cycloisomerase 2 family)